MSKNPPISLYKLIEDMEYYDIGSCLSVSLKRRSENII